MQYRFLCSAAILALLVLIGCNASDTPPTTTGGSKAVGENTVPTRPARPARPPRPVSLAVGTIAPEIAGVDTDGTEFKLSDYKGKIVMVDFWGDW